MIPEDIPPAKYVSVFVGVCLILGSVLAWAPVFFAIYYDGFARIANWSGALWGFFLFASVMFGLGVWLLFWPHRPGARAVFHEGGFTLRIRGLFRKERCHRIDWADVEEMTVLEAPRQQDAITFLLSREAALREGLIQPTTKPPAVAARTLSFPIALALLNASDAADRFIASAQHAGARLVETSGFNVVVFVRRIWKVTWP